MPGAPVKRADIAVIGSGFGGSLIAMIARRLGRSVILVERGRHPRFAIGESSTPLANLILEDLAQQYRLPGVASLARWGRWQRTCPEICGGLKRGFTFFHHQFDTDTGPEVPRSKQLLVAASPRDDLADSHWLRADVDHFFVKQAMTLGVQLLDQTIPESISIDHDPIRLVCRQNGSPLEIHARSLVDASGPRGSLSRLLPLRESAFENYPRTEALFSHFSNVMRLDSSPQFSGGSPPYPIDDAAVHHIFDRGWIWVLRFKNGTTSAGVSAERSLARELNFVEGGAAWHRLLSRLPAVNRQFAGAVALRPFTHIDRLPFRSATAAGNNWVLLPSAAGFVDPLLSTGFPLTLLGIERLARILESDWMGRELASKLGQYEAQTLKELDRAAALIGVLFRHLGSFDRFCSLALLYFAAASYSETLRRLGKSPPGFLLCDDPVFSVAFQQIHDEAQKSESSPADSVLEKMVRKAIEPIDVAGLTDPSRRNWHPVDFSDLRDAAGKLRVDPSQIERLIESLQTG